MPSSPLIIIIIFSFLVPLDSISPIYTRCGLHAKDVRNFCRVSKTNNLPIKFQHKQQCANFCEQTASTHPSYTPHVNDYQTHFSQYLTNKMNFPIEINSKSISINDSDNFLEATSINHPHIRLPNITLSFQNCYAFNFYAASGLCQLFDQNAPTSYRLSVDSCTYYEKTTSGSCLLNTYEHDCAEVPGEDASDNGVYWIQINNLLHPIYCIFMSSNKYTVFQRRVDGEVDFRQDWQHYKMGFGNIAGNFWLGNELVHKWTTKYKYTMRVYIETFTGEYAFQDYSDFVLQSEQFNYTLQYTSSTGSAKDALYNGAPFTTLDRDNDKYSSNCAVKFNCGWWYLRCHSGILNGLYTTPATHVDDMSISWFPYGYGVSMRYAVMMLTRLVSKQPATK